MHKLGDFMNEIGHLSTYPNCNHRSCDDKCVVFVMF